MGHNDINFFLPFEMPTAKFRQATTETDMLQILRSLAGTYTKLVAQGVELSYDGEPVTNASDFIYKSLEPKKNKKPFSMHHETNFLGNGTLVMPEVLGFMNWDNGMDGSCESCQSYSSYSGNPSRVGKGLHDLHCVRDGEFCTYKANHVGSDGKPGRPLADLVTEVIREI